MIFSFWRSFFAVLLVMTVLVTACAPQMKNTGDGETLVAPEAPGKTQGLTASPGRMQVDLTENPGTTGGHGPQGDGAMGVVGGIVGAVGSAVGIEQDLGTTNRGGGPVAQGAAQGAAQGTAQGTMDGGGADLIPDPDASEEDVARAIDAAKIMVPYVLRYFEALDNDDHISLNVWSPQAWPPMTHFLRAFFKKPSVDSAQKSSDVSQSQDEEDIYLYFKNLHWEIRPDKPCYDEYNNEKAASAFPYEEPSICLSVPMIVKVAKKVNLVRRLTAVIVHELSHKRGIGRKGGIGDESLSKDFEEKLADLLPENPVQELRQRHEQLHPLVFAHSEQWVQSLGPDYGASKISQETSLTSYSGQAAVLLRKDPKPDEAKLCELLQKMQLTGFAIISVMPDNDVPLELFRPEDFAAVKKLKELSQALTAHCVQKSQPLDHKKMLTQVEQIYKYSRHLSDALLLLDPSLETWETMRKSFEPQ